MVEAWQQRSAQWIAKRLPPQTQLTLAQRTIFIVPTKTALGLLGLLLLLGMLGINFQNSLIYAVCFWLLALFILNIFYTYRNLSGITLKAIRIDPCFAGGKATLELELSRPPNNTHWNVLLQWPEQDEVLVELASSQTVRVQLAHLAEQRGYFAPPRLKISTTYPTGLAIAWSYFTPSLKGLVYPAPLKAEAFSHSTSDSEQEGKISAEGGSDFNEIRSYRIGDPLQRIHWAKYAQTGQLYTKAFVDYVSEDCWLDWANVPAASVETRLSILCAQVLSLSEQQRPFGLKIPGQTFPPQLGDAHRDQCLKALALYGLAHD